MSFTAANENDVLNKRERSLWNAEIGGAEVRLSVRTDTRIDTGRWWRATPLKVCVTDDELVVLAAARRRYIQRIPRAACRDSCYCHTTGELVIDADDDLRFSRLAMSPTDALKVLLALDAAVVAEKELMSGTSENQSA